MGASEELEVAATKYAQEAIRLDKQGSTGLAITKYQRAIETLLKLTHLYPEYGLNKVYIQRAMAYQERIQALQGAVAAVPVPKQKRKEDGTFEPVAKEEKESSYDDLIIKNKPNIKWEEVVGLEDAKKAIKEAIVYPVQRPDLFPLGWPRGILLFGPPGCGKTLLAAAVATEIEATFVTIDAASIMSKWLGEAEKNVKQLFDSSRKSVSKGKPNIIFIDELDSLIGRHSNEVGGEIRMRNQFLKEMDGIMDKGKKLHVYVIGATNKPWDLDWAFIRRFQKRILVPLPDHNTRLPMIKLYTHQLNIAANVDLHEIARLAEGFSGSDIRDVCQSVHLRVVGEFFESGQAENKKAKPKPLTMKHFIQTLEQRKPSVSLDQLTQYNKWFEAFKAL